jgi:hypothetical protein
MLEHCLDARSRRLEAGPKGDRARNQDMEKHLITRRGSAKRTLLIHLRGAGLQKREVPAKGLQSPSLLWSPEETKEVEVFTTLKRVCPSEYQGAQGAFKDSMIH